MLNLQKENEELLGMLDFKRQTKLMIRPARVVNKGIQPNLLSIVIDGGTIDGIQNNQAVLTPEGVIGKTIETGDKASIVQLITDTNFRLSVRILPSGATGIMRFINGNTSQIREVQKNVVINIGDKVVTSGGITGTVERLIDNDKVEVEIAENVKVEIVKSTGIQSLVNTNTQEVKK